MATLQERIKWTLGLNFGSGSFKFETSKQLLNFMGSGVEKKYPVYCEYRDNDLFWEGENYNFDLEKKDKIEAEWEDLEMSFY